jgi:hypothetical protein
MAGNAKPSPVPRMNLVKIRGMLPRDAVTGVRPVHNDHTINARMRIFSPPYLMGEKFR